MAQDFHLRISAGPSLSAPLSPVPANTLTPTTIDGESSTCKLTLHVQNLRSPPLPRTSPYFSHANHVGDLYGICMDFTPKASDVRGDELLFGNHFSRPIRDSLPLGFGVMFAAARWVDPSLVADVLADEPWVYAPVLASMSTISVGGAGRRPEVGGLVERNGMELSAKARKKHFLAQERRKEWVFRAGTEYALEFSGPWLDFGGFKVVIPGFKVDLLKYWDGQPLRYVLLNGRTGEVYLVVEFELVPVEKGVKMCARKVDGVSGVDEDID